MIDSNIPSYNLCDFLIVLVLYRIDLENSPSFLSLKKCNKKEHHIDVMVYDNSPSESVGSRQITENGFQIQYINDPSNPGVSKAYNTGIDLAVKKDRKWILFLDQDTSLDEKLLDKYLEQVNNYNNISIFSTTLFDSNKNLISPSRYFFKRGFTMAEVPNEKCELKKIRPINSSVLVATKVFEDIGVYNEKIRLDFSDHEFFDRVSKKYAYMQVVPSNSFHSLSTSDDTNVDGIKIRFGIFCKGAHVAGENSIISSFQYFIVCGMRALKLSLKFKSLFFIITLINEWTKSTK